MMEPSKVLKSSQEQAVAAWIGYLNQLRIDALLESLHEQEVDLERAFKSIDDAVKKIDVEIIERNRGGDKGMHGFIAEVAEVGVGNARRLVVGEETNLEWINNNSSADIRRYAEGAVVDIQQKFVNSGGKFSLGAVAEHLQQYPDFVKNGGKYQIPSDHYAHVKELLAMTREEAGKLSGSGSGLSYKEWEKVQRFFEDTKLSFNDIEPSHLTYREVQQGAIHKTLEVEKDKLRETAKERGDQAYQESLPSLKEGAKATVAAAAIEGSMAFVMAVIAKRKEGRVFREFDEDDWSEILEKTGKEFGKGGIRGASIYFLTNHTATSAAVASALVTAAFGIAEQAHRFREGEIEEVEFIDNSEMLCLDASVSAISSFVGQALIPLPVFGAVIGNTVGTVMYQVAKDKLSAKEQAIIEAYAKEQRALDTRLEAEYGNLIDSLNEGMVAYLALLDRAFDPNPALAFEGSIALALQLGVPSEQILDTREKARIFFVE